MLALLSVVTSVVASVVCRSAALSQPAESTGTPCYRWFGSHLLLDAARTFAVPQDIRLSRSLILHDTLAHSS